MNSYYHKLSENVWVWGSGASRSGGGEDVTIAGRTTNKKERKGYSAIRPWTAEMSKKATNCWNSKPVDRVKDPLRLNIELPENLVGNAGPVNHLKKVQSVAYIPNRVKVVTKE